MSAFRNFVEIIPNGGELVFNAMIDTAERPVPAAEESYGATESPPMQITGCWMSSMDRVRSVSVIVTHRVPSGLCYLAFQVATTCSTPWPCWRSLPASGLTRIKFRKPCSGFKESDAVRMYSEK